MARVKSVFLHSSSLSAGSTIAALQNHQDPAAAEAPNPLTGLYRGRARHFPCCGRARGDAVMNIKGEGSNWGWGSRVTHRTLRFSLALGPCQAGLHSGTMQAWPGSSSQDQTGPGSGKANNSVPLQGRRGSRITLLSWHTGMRGPQILSDFPLRGGEGESCAGVREREKTLSL